MRVAIIPARGGSKRIPKKNVKDFLGKPIIAYAIETAKRSELFDKIVVSTDCDEIACCAKKYGAEVPFIRPADLADDFATTSAVVKHCLSFLKEQGDDIDHVCCIYATSPLLQEEYLVEGFSKLVDTDYSYSFSVSSFEAPIQRALRINTDKEVEAIWPENNLTRSQDLEETFHDAGQFYWAVPEAFMEDRPIFSNKSLPVVIPRQLTQDIDTHEDWVIAECLYQSVNQEK